MKFTKEAIKENEKTILKIMSCQCGETLMIGAPVMKPKVNENGLELDYFTAICPECETQWKVKFNFEEKQAKVPHNDVALNRRRAS